MNSPVLPMTEQGGVLAPEAAHDLRTAGVDAAFLADLAVKTAHTVPQFNTKWLAEELALPAPPVEELLKQMTHDHFVEVLGMEGPFNQRYAITGRGHERAGRLLEVSGYIGPTPVSLDAYTAMIHFHHSRFPEVTFDQVRGALADMVLPEDDVLTAALAVMSQRSLFLFGPAGNGKTTVARCLHNVTAGELWVPHAVIVGQEVIRIFDPQLHEEVKWQPPQPWKIDRRWVRIRRPLVIAGGEMTLESLELSSSPWGGFYEAPLHIKSNCGTFVIDDLGRQRIQPKQLLNRWIIPMEHGFDFFDLKSGHKVRLPFQQMLIVATNLELNQVTDPAFLRRMGYRLHLETPDEQRYRQIFEKYAARWWTEVPSGLLDRLLERYRSEGRELRGCEPRDLLGRVQDICQLKKQPMELNDDVLEQAWTSYFGTKRTRL